MSTMTLWVTLNFRVMKWLLKMNHKNINKSKKHAERILSLGIEKEYDKWETQQKKDHKEGKKS